MCDCIRTMPLVISVSKYKGLGFTSCTFRQYFPGFHSSVARNAKLKFVNTRTTRDSSFLGSEEEDDFSDELQFKEKGKVYFELDSQFYRGLSIKNDKGNDSCGLDVELKDRESKENEERYEEEDLSEVEGSGKIKESKQHNERLVVRTGRQVIRRSNIMAKQVISIRSALSLGFVSQIWVDTSSWMVLVLEVRPNLLSGESERLLLEDITQVGDVVLVEDDNVIEREWKMIGLETLVGYNVVTPGRRNVGKVRGYSFNINSGAVESLELDSFGISVIPSSLISTYALFVEDVIEVLPDRVIVHEAAASRIQRLTKGFWDAQNARTSIDELEEYSDQEGSIRPFRSRSTRRTFGGTKFQPKMRQVEDDWELPMDYL